MKTYSQPRKTAVLAVTASTLMLWAIAASAQFGDLLRRARDRVDEIRDDVEEIEDAANQAASDAEAVVDDSASSLLGAAGGALDDAAAVSFGDEGFAGPWVGVFQSDSSSFIRMTMDMPSEAGGDVAIPLELEPLPGGYGGPTGSISASVAYDSAARIVTFTVDAAEARRLQMHVNELHGFVNPENSTIVGTFSPAPAGSSPYFFMTRPEQIDRMVLDRLPENIWQARSIPPSGDAYDARTLSRWTQKIHDEYPGVDFGGMLVGELQRAATNLFRDEHFAAHFGTTFDRLSDEEVGRIVSGIREMPGGGLGTEERNRWNVLSQAQIGFISTTGFGYPGLTLSVAAMRNLDRWRAQAIRRLEATPASLDTFRTARTIETAVERLSPYLWPSETTALAGAVQAGLARSSERALHDEVERLLAGDGIEGARAIRDALRMGSGGSAGAPAAAATARAQARVRMPVGVPAADAPPTLAELAAAAPETWQALEPQLVARLDGLLEEGLRGPRAELGLAGGSRPGAAIERLGRSKAWIDANTGLVASFSGAAAMDAFVGELAAQREADLREALPELSAQFAALTTTPEARAFATDLASGIDSGMSPAWQELEGLRARRIAELDREAFLARVGEGPFDAEHAGAVYLNALYRADLARIEEEDQAVIQPIARTMIELMSSSGLDQLTAALSGGMLAEGMSGVIAEQAERYSMAQPLAGFFIIAYERVYPECMEADAVEFSHTVTWETVVTNGFGTELYRYPSGSRTDYYTVNRRHADAFRRIGIVSGPEEIDFNTSLFGGFLPSEMTAPLRTITDNLRGLRMAMTEYACDSPEMRRIEQTLISKAMAAM